MGIYARDGSIRVTSVEDGLPITVLPHPDEAGRIGQYARDGSIRVTVVGYQDPTEVASIRDQESIVIGSDTYTFTVVNGEITNIVVS